MDVVQAAGLNNQADQSDIGCLLEWIHYHDALSRFSVHHWRHKSLTLGAAKEVSPVSQSLQHQSLAKYRPVKTPESRFSSILLSADIQF